MRLQGHVADATERRLIRPLGLRGTSLPGTSTYIEGPHGYIPEDGAQLDFTEMNPTLFGASGDMISTTRDLDRFVAALLGGHLLPARLLEARLLEAMKTPGISDGRYASGCRGTTPRAGSGCTATTATPHADQAICR